MIDEKFFKEQLSALKGHIDARMNGLEKRMDGLGKRLDDVEKRGESIDKFLQKVFVEVEAIRSDMRLIAEGYVMLGENLVGSNLNIY